MTTETYRIFLAIAKHKSFSKVAKLFYVSTPAISHQISLLEDEFEFPLFKRNKTGVELTQMGEAIYPKIYEIVKKEDELKQLVSVYNGLGKGSIRLGIFNSMCYFIPNLIKKFKELFPQITFEIYQGSYEDIIGWLKNSQIDLGFLSKSVNKEFNFYTIFEDPLMCILPLDYEDIKSITLDEMSNLPFIMQRESCDADAKRLITKLSLDIHTTCHVVDDLTTVSMVEAGYGIAIMPRLTMMGLENRVKMVTILPLDKRIIGVVTKDEELSPAAKEFLKFIKNYNFEGVIYE